MYHSVLSLVPLGDDEQDDKYAKGYKRANDSSAIPGLRDATPLHNEDVADYSTDYQKQADEIHLDQHLAPTRTDFWRLVAEE
jgi:hypothetical protein